MDDTVFSFLHDLTPLGILAVFLFLVLDRLIPRIVLNGRKANGNNSSIKGGGSQSSVFFCPLDREGALRDIENLCKLVREINEEVKWMREVHDHFDRDGVPVWYSPKQQIETLVEETRQTNRLLSKLISLREGDRGAMNRMSAVLDTFVTMFRRNGASLPSVGTDGGGGKGGK